MPPLTTPFPPLLDVVANSVRQDKEIKHMQIGKEEIKVSLFADVIIYLDNLDELTKTKQNALLELLSEYSQFAGYKVKIQK